MKACLHVMAEFLGLVAALLAIGVLAWIGAYGSLNAAFMGA